MKITETLKKLYGCHDGFCNTMINLCADVVSYPIGDLFNQMLIHEKFPDVSKLAEVLPFHKKSSY